MNERYSNELDDGRKWDIPSAINDVPNTEQVKVCYEVKDPIEGSKYGRYIWTYLDGSLFTGKINYSHQLINGQITTQYYRHIKNGYDHHDTDIAQSLVKSRWGGEKYALFGVIYETLQELYEHQPNPEYKKQIMARILAGKE